MVRVSSTLGEKSKYAPLLRDPTVARWYRNVARGSPITADVYLRRVGNVCADRGTTLSAIVTMRAEDRRDFLADLVTSMEDAKKAGSYIESTLKAFRSWLAFNGVNVEHRIKVKGTNATPSLEGERVPTQEELHGILMAATPRERCAAVLMAHAGLRPETLGSYKGTDGLRLKDLPELVVKDGTVTFKTLPMVVAVRPELSKSGRRYITFVGPEAARYLKVYLEERMRDGAKLDGDSDVIAPVWAEKKFLTTINVSDAIRKAIRAAGFAWRPYVLRSYFDTQLLLSESKGNIANSYRRYLMGHLSGIEGRYTVDKNKLPPNLIEDIRAAYRRSLPFLETARLPGSGDKELKAAFRREILLVAGLAEKEVAKLDLEAMTDADLQRRVRERLLSPVPDAKGNGNNGSRQKVVPLDQVEGFIEEGWEFVVSLPDGRAILRLSG